jgi:hypothetical protein
MKQFIYRFFLLQLLFAKIQVIRLSKYIVYTKK